MFRCNDCGKMSKTGEVLNKRIITIRPQEYTTYVIKKRNKDSYDSKEEVYTVPSMCYSGIGEITNITKGSEIVKEINVCGGCKGTRTKESVCG